MIRKALGYKSQTAFGKTIGLSQTGYSDIERGKNKLTSQNKILLQQTHNVNIDFIENRSNQMFLDSVEMDLVLEGSQINVEHLTREKLMEEVQRLNVQVNTFIDVIKSQQKTIELLQEQLEERK